MLTERLLKHRTGRLLCAAASAAALQLFTGGSARGTLPTPDILTCQVVPSQYVPFQNAYGDNSNFPRFYLTWDARNYTNPDNITFYFYQGLNSTNIGTNCWQVFNSNDWTHPRSSPPGYPANTMVADSASAANDNFDFLPFDANGDYLSVFDSSIEYEIGVQAFGDQDQSDFVWIVASYTT